MLNLVFHNATRTSRDDVQKLAAAGEDIVNEAEVAGGSRGQIMRSFKCEIWGYHSGDSE
jgi:hypothetical protein